MISNYNFKTFIAIFILVLILILPISYALQLTNYNPYGDVIEGGNDRFTYNSRELDDTGLFYYGARYYIPYIGRYGQADPNIPNVYDPQSLNRYSYVLNNPYKYVDPGGDVAFLAPILVGAGIGAVVTGGISAYIQYRDTGSINLADVGKAAGVGAVAGATAAFGGFGAGALLGGGTVGAIGGGAVAGATGGEVGVFGSSLIQGTQYSFDPTRAATNAILGGVIGGVGYKVSSAIAASKTNFASKDLLKSHFEDHKVEFGFTSEKQYLDNARNLVNSKIGGNIEGYTRPNGDIVRYNINSGALGVKNKDGTIRTFFKPKEGYAYYLGDKNKHSSSGGTRK